MTSKSSKWLLLGLMRSGKPKSEVNKRIPEDISRLLLVKQADRLGNIILLNSAINAIMDNFPRIKLDLLLPAGFGGLLDGDPRVNRIFAVAKKQILLKPWKLVSLIGDLRKQKYDLAIDCSDVNSHSLTGAMYTTLSGAKLTAGWRIGEKRTYDIEAPRYSETVHASEMYLRLLSGVFERKMDGSPFFISTGPDSATNEKRIGINCGGRGSKKWPLEKFLQVGSMLGESGVQVDFILGPDEVDERASLQGILPANGRLLPLTPIAQLKNIIADYALFISSDTGPMHLAWSLGVPTIAIFLDSEIEKFKPLSDGSIAFDAKNGIDEKQVYDAAISILKKQRIPA